MANRRRRPLAVASVVMVTLAGAVVLRSLTADSPETSPSDDPTSPAATSVTAGVSASAEPGPPLVATEPVLEKRTFSAGEQVTVKHGIGFLNAADGSLETWSGPAVPPSIHPTPDGALLVSYSQLEDEPTTVTERASGRAWQFAVNIHPRPELAHGTRIAVSVRRGDIQQPALLDVATGTLTPIGPEMHYLAGFQGAPSPDGLRLAIQLGNEVALIELASGRLTPLVEDVPDDGQQVVAALPGALGFTVAGDSSTEVRRWFSWEGVEIERELGPGAVSPGGRYIAREWSPGRIKAGGMGGFPAVGAITIEERLTGRPLVRFLGAEPVPFPDYAWSAAGDSLVIEVPDGYRVMSASGSTLAAIPDDIHVLSPRPSPTTPGLLGTNRGTVINVARGSTVAPLYAELPWRAHWSTRPGELIVELSSPGKGRDWPVDVMPFDVRSRDLEGPPEVAVDTDAEECAPLRARPETNAAEVECMPDGLRGRITEAEDPSPEPKPSSEPVRRYVGIRERDNTAWLHLEMEDGKSGWARADELTWAN